MRTHQSIVTTAALVITAAVSACTSAPQRNDQLDQARAAVRTLEEDPNAQQAAAEPLRDARSNLERANQAFESHASPEQVTYLAYLADREAQAGEAQANAYRASEELARGGEERNRILLQARTQEARQARAAAQSQAENAQVAQQQAQTAQQSAQNEAQQAQAAQQTAQNEAQQAQLAREQAQQAEAQLQKEQQQLSDLKAQQTARGLELTLASDLLFNTGSSTLKPGAMLQLNRLAGFMRSNPQTKIIVEGYTDSRGSAEYNEQLSTGRAQAVADELVTQGIAADRVQAVGRGKDYPVATNDTNAGRQQNRRVDIVLSDMSGRFANGATQAPQARAD